MYVITFNECVHVITKAKYETKILEQQIIRQDKNDNN